jgi:hypothetical protein
VSGVEKGGRGSIGLIEILRGLTMDDETRSLVDIEE